MGSNGAEESKKLNSSHRSSCSCRVRIALDLKGIDYEYKAVNLFKGEQFSPEYLKLNPIGYILVLVDGDITLSDSFAILMAANIVLSSIQPLQNLGVLKYIDEKVGLDESLLWIQSHSRNGYGALEKLLDKYAEKYATGDEVFLADLFLAPQIRGAIKRFNLDMTEYPLLSRLNEAYKELPAFQNAMPEKQPDAPIESI